MNDTQFWILLTMVGFYGIANAFQFEIVKDLLKRKPEPDWKAIAGRMYTILAYPEEDSATYCCKRAIRVYEEAAKK